MVALGLPTPNEDIKIQIYRLICKYTFNHQLIISSFKTEEEIYEFIDTAYAYYLEKGFKNFDENKGTLSTHIYVFLDYFSLAFIYQIKYNVSFAVAKYLTKNNVKNKDRCFKIYDTDSMDTITSGKLLPFSDPNDFEDDSMGDLSFADDNNEIDNYIEDDNNKYLLTLFSSIVDSYIKSRNNVPTFNSSQTRQIIKDYVLNGETLEFIAKKYNLSRQRIQQKLNNFYSYARKQEKLRNLLCG